ncbi:MAG: sensor histidine kinase [Lachnospiraceae bacterium]|nr:sensor histidine kinase [Lachnospiraceae bacterium]
MKVLIQRIRNLSLYRKFALAILSLGLIPMFVIFPLMIRQAAIANLQSIRTNYEQAAGHIASSTENVLSVYDNISKIMYQYTGSENALNVGQYYVNFDLLRQVLTLQDPERKLEMESFLQSLDQVDAYVYAVHFLTDAEAPIGSLDFHYSYRRTYFSDLENLKETYGYDALDRTSKKLMLIGPHPTRYYSGTSDEVFTVARNYYDLRGMIGQEKYIGTLFIDIDMTRLTNMLKTMQLGEEADYFLMMEDGVCLYSTVEEAVGASGEEVLLGYPEKNYDRMISDVGEYGLTCIAEVSKTHAYASVNSMIQLILLLGLVVLVILLFGAYLFSKTLTRPLYDMMDQMKKVESGAFDIHLPVKSNDEIGELSRRFNEMSHELEKYINQSYVARIRQSEAELTAIKSQIYPHFLYNTLEIIRMTAVENQDEQVSRMIDSLSQQIHYLIGSVEDTVPLEKELDILKKYVFLLNCRIEGKVNLDIEMEEALHPMIPKLILQPIVENAYVHGIRPKTGSGNILVSVSREGALLEISVLDNGVGMNEEELSKLKDLLQGDEPGIKNEYNWQSIGMKNVQDRLRFLYGEDYGLSIASTVGLGTSVQIRMPYFSENAGCEENYDPNDTCG